MNFLSNLKIRNNVILAFGVILLFAAGIGTYSITRVTLVNALGVAVMANVSLQNSGSGGGRPIKFPALKAMRERDPAHQPDFKDS